MSAPTSHFLSIFRPLWISSILPVFFSPGSESLKRGSWGGSHALPRARRSNYTPEGQYSGLGTQPTCFAAQPSLSLSITHHHPGFGSPAIVASASCFHTISILSSLLFLGINGKQPLFYLNLRVQLLYSQLWPLNSSCLMSSAVRNILSLCLLGFCFYYFSEGQLFQPIHCHLVPLISL